MKVDATKKSTPLNTASLQQQTDKFYQQKGSDMLISVKIDDEYL